MKEKGILSGSDLSEMNKLINSVSKEFYLIYA